MFRLIGMVLSIGLADSANPSTLAPGLYLASGERPRRAVLQFTLAVLVVNVLGGAIIVLGPGQMLLALVPRPSAIVRQIAEVVAGLVLLIVATVLWRRRHRLARRELPSPKAHRRSGALLGLSIAAVELPTAFPYFAAIAAIVGSGFALPRQFMLLMLYNLCFVLPLLLIVATVVFAGDRAGEILTKARAFLQRHWPRLLSGLALIAGTFVLLLGATGLASASHGPVGHFSRSFQHVVHHRGRSTRTPARPRHKSQGR